MSHLYLIADSENQYYKIGKTSAPVTRLYSLEIGGPLLLRYVTLLEGLGYLETAVLDHYRRQGGQIRGEWFKGFYPLDFVAVVQRLGDLPEVTEMVIQSQEQKIYSVPVTSAKVVDPSWKSYRYPEDRKSAYQRKKIRAKAAEDARRLANPEKYAVKDLKKNRLTQ
jgi:hypothetical protein